MNKSILLKRKLSSNEYKEHIRNIDFYFGFYPRNNLKNWIINKIENKDNSIIIINEDDITELEELEVNKLIHNIQLKKLFALDLDCEELKIFELNKDSIDLFSLWSEYFLYDSDFSFLIYYSSYNDVFIFYGEELINILINNFPDWRDKMKLYLRTWNI